MSVFCNQFGLWQSITGDFNLLFQGTFQTLQLSAKAKIDTHNPELFVIGEDTLTVSDRKVYFL